MPNVKAIAESSHLGLSEMALKSGEIPRDRIFLGAPTSLAHAPSFISFAKGSARQMPCLCVPYFRGGGGGGIQPGLPRDRDVDVSAPDDNNNN